MKTAGVVVCLNPSCRSYHEEIDAGDSAQCPDCGYPAVVKTRRSDNFLDLVGRANES